MAPNVLDDQQAAAAAATRDLLREVMPDAIKVALSPARAAELCHDGYRMCVHLAALPIQPTVFDRDGLARCRPCFAIEWIIHPRLACEVCDNPEATAVVAARVAYLALVTAVCALCRPPDPLTE